MTYLIEMGVDPKLLQLSLSIPSSDIRYLTAGEMTQFGVELPPKDRTCSGLRFRADELAWRLIP
ncbi:hypothetical protein CN113_36720 [Sinorhizobium meliloti]|nr:hypothetical protein CN113_36720 [Sinorhizobium meliloti]